MIAIGKIVITIPVKSRFVQRQLRLQILAPKIVVDDTEEQVSAFGPFGSSMTVVGVVAEPGLEP